MHRSSESVAAIATALAKAQMELSNPEKSAIGSVRYNNQEAQQTFRYAPLSTGLDIVRKILGGHQIAFAQTMEIDRAGANVNLTTVLLHSSGEWISSDWPVCALSEMSQPRRMGAALTYARRYALFTMVGIAGEDDLDAPSDLTSSPANVYEVGQKATGSNSNSKGAIIGANEPRVVPPGPIPQTGEKPSADQAGDRVAGIILEIQSLSEDDLKSQAIAILKAKNRLSADDAKRVEDAFAARMGQQAGTDDSLKVPTDEPPQQPPQASGGAAKRPRERTRKVKATEPSAPRNAPTDETRMATVVEQANLPPGKIQKSELWISEPRRIRDKSHLKFVGSQPCLVCGKSPADAHHLRFAQPRGMGLKVSDEFTVPLCRAHHRDNHRFGDEKVWWSKTGIDPIEISQRFWAVSRGNCQQDEHR